MAKIVAAPEDTIRVVRVFLASPGDLADERRAAREAVDEVNKTIARPAGYHVDLIGWEDTLSAQGRPQAIINDDLRTCHMFIGMLWARWGTPPDLDGTYSSGFEEEFSIAVTQFKEIGRPFPRLYFKNVDIAQVKDPGPELSKVLAFKDKIANEKSILFATFENSSDFASKVRLSVADYINKLRSQREEHLLSEGEASKSSPRHAADQQSSESPTVSDVQEEAGFLKDAADRLLSNRGDIDELDVARLRNLANVLRGHGNDEATLQAHDANIIYTRRSELSLSDKEVSALADAGLASSSNENVPLWTWLQDRMKAVPDWLTLSTLVGPEAQRLGAFRALTALKAPVVVTWADWSRSDIIKAWFNDGQSTPLRNGALRYLASAGEAGDVDTIEREISRNESGTLRTALEAGTALVQRLDGSRAAAHFLIDHSFDELAGVAYGHALDAFDELDSEKLTGALDHRSGDVRLRALKTLHHRGKITSDATKALFSDTSLKVRAEAVAIIDASNEALSQDEKRKILVKPAASSRGLLGLGMAPYDADGELALESAKMQSLKYLPIGELESIARKISLDSDAYFMFCRRRPQKSLKELRRHFDDRFETRFQSYLDESALLFKGASDASTVLAKIKDAKEWTVKEWMRKAADVLVELGDEVDLGRIRKALDEDCIEPRNQDMVYLGRKGSREDIKRIKDIYSDYRSQGPRATILGHKYPNEVATDAIGRILNGQIAPALDYDIPRELLSHIISTFSKRSFAELSQVEIDTLLSHRDDLVRKATALRMVDVLPLARVKALFKAYVQREYRFYNVIHWLDLVEAYSLEKARRIARRELVAISCLS